MKQKSHAFRAYTKQGDKMAAISVSTLVFLYMYNNIKFIQ